MAADGASLREGGGDAATHIPIYPYICQTTYVADKWPEGIPLVPICRLLW